MLWTSVANNTGQDSIDILDAYTFEQLSAYKHNATLFIDKGTFIKVLNQTTYQLVGGSKERVNYNQQYKIDIEYKALVNNNNPGGRGLGLKVFEQISHCEAVLYGKREENWLILEQDLTEHDFSE
ncbi:unnamed protein product [Rotaria sp. Silwood1]|nr:unnamed protein product [Rotaria sp. Silwood1]